MRFGLAHVLLEPGGALLGVADQGLDDVAFERRWLGKELHGASLPDRYRLRRY
jgi:hypothetical protein